MLSIVSEKHAQLYSIKRAQYCIGKTCSALLHQTCSPFYQQNVLSISSSNVLIIFSVRPPSNVLTILSTKRAQHFFVKRAQNILIKLALSKHAENWALLHPNVLTAFQANMLKLLHQTCYFFSWNFFIKRCQICFPKSTRINITSFEETNPLLANL